MPLGGLLPYPDEEEERRRRGLPPEVPRRPTPLMPPDVLPEAGMGEPAPLPTRGNPGALPSPMPSLRPPNRGEQIYEARDVYLQGTPGRGKSALTGALRGFLEGGGLLGAGMGALSGAVDPRGLREDEFNRRVRPQIVDRFAIEDADRAAVTAAEDRQLNNAYRTAQIGELESQAEKNRRPTILPPPRPIISPRGLYDPAARGIIPGTEPLPPQPRELAPRPVLNERGEYVDFNAETKAGRRVKAFQKPEKSGGGRKAKEPPKVVSMTQIRQYMKATGKSRSDAIADAMRDGYRIAK